MSILIVRIYNLQILQENYLLEKIGKILTNLISVITYSRKYEPASNINQLTKVNLKKTDCYKIMQPFLEHDLEYSAKNLKLDLTS